MAIIKFDKGAIYVVVDHNSSLRRDLQFSELVFCRENVVANTASDDNIEFVGKLVCNKTTIYNKHTILEKLPEEDEYFHIKGTDMYILYGEDVNFTISKSSYFTFMKILSLEELELAKYIINEYKFHENKSKIYNSIPGVTSEYKDYKLS